MSNLKITDKQWRKAREYFEAGLSLSQVSDKTGISKTRLHTKSREDSWSKGTQKEQLIAEAIKVERQKVQLCSEALDVHLEIVNDAVRAINFFGGAAVRNVHEAMSLPCETHQDFRARAEVINKGREAVLGKMPDTAIQVNTGNQQPVSAIQRIVVDAARDQHS